MRGIIRMIRRIEWSSLSLFLHSQLLSVLSVLCCSMPQLMRKGILFGQPKCTSTFCGYSVTQFESVSFAKLMYPFIVWHSFYRFCCNNFFCNWCYTFVSSEGFIYEETKIVKIKTFVNPSCHIISSPICI